MDYSILRIFSCSTYSLVDSQKRNKLESKSKKYNFIRFTKGVKGFKLWDPETFTSRDVVFNEEPMLQERSKTEDKVKGRAQDSSADIQIKRVEFSNGSKKPDRSNEMETNKRLLRSNLDR